MKPTTLDELATILNNIPNDDDAELTYADEPNTVKST